jgi:predicted amidohydrolase
VARLLRIAALQLHAHDRSAFAENTASLLGRVDAAAREHDLVVLPEATLPAYVLGNEAIDDRAVTAVLSEIQGIAARNRRVIVAGAAVRREGRLYNSATVIDRDGAIAGSAEKIFLWHFDRKWFAPGERLMPVQTTVGRLGVLVCADGRIPTIASTLVDRGAELLVMPTAWVTSGRDPNALENVQADLLARVRAFENGVPFVAANKCGAELGMVAYCGKSQIVNANGEIAALASQTQEETISAVISLETPRPRRAPNAPAPQHRTLSDERAVRVAISAHQFPGDIASRLNMIDAELAIGPSGGLRQAQGDTGVAKLDQRVPAALLDAAVAFDPSVLPAYRSAGYRAIVLEAMQPDPWLERVARARALELRIFVIVLDRANGRAYAVDPDGTVVAGTFGDYRIASFVLDVRKTLQTTIAPGTDIAAGLDRVGMLTRLEAMHERA